MDFDHETLQYVEKDDALLVAVPEPIEAQLVDWLHPEGEHPEADLQVVYVAAPVAILVTDETLDEEGLVLYDVRDLRRESDT